MSGNIYETVFHTRLTSPNDEEDITVDNVQVIITSDDASNNSSVKKAWIVPAEDKDGNIIPGQVDLKVAVTKAGVYKINVIPYTLSEEQKDKFQFTYTAENHMEPNAVEMTGFKKTIKNGDGTTKDVSAEDPNYKVQPGDIIFTDIKFQKSVTNKDLGITTPTFEYVYPPSTGLSVVVYKDNIANALVAGENKDYSYEFGTPDSNETIRLSITINKDLRTPANSSIAQRIKVEIGVNNIPLITNGGNNTALIYNSSKYTLTLGTSGSGTENPVSIQMKADNYKNYNADSNRNIIGVSKVQDAGTASGNYYTIIPISLKDQYGNTTITGDIFKNKIGMITTNNSGGTSDANLVEMIPVAKEGNNYIKQNVDDETIEIDKVGIAISSAVTDKTKLRELQNSSMKVSFGDSNNDRAVTNMNPLTVYTNPASTIDVSQESIDTVTCFEEKVIATLTTKNTDLSFLTEKEVAIKVLKDGTEINAVYGKYNTGENADFGYEVEEDKTSQGTIKLKVWSKYMGSYTITPYIKGTTSKEAQGDPIPVNFAHNTKINKVVIKNENDTSSNKPELVTGNIGSDTLTVPRGGSKVFYLKYYHKYENGYMYEITEVFGQDVTILLNDPTGSRWSNVDSLVDDPEKMNWENSNLWNVAPRKDALPLETNKEVADGKLQIQSMGDTKERVLNNIRVYSGGKTSGPLNLTIKIADDKKTAEYRPEGFQFKVGEPEAITLKVGNNEETEEITAYQADPKLTASATFPNSDDPSRQDSLYVLSDGTLVYKWNADDEYCLYYTLVSIQSTTNQLVQSFVSDDLTDKMNKSKLTFIDSDRDKGNSANTINLAKFNVTRSGSSYNVVMNSEKDNLTHVGIAISKYDIDFEEKLNGKNEVDIIETYVYNGSNERFKTIKIKAVKPAEPSATSDTPATDRVPNVNADEPVQNSAPTDTVAPKAPEESTKPSENPTGGEATASPSTSPVVSPSSVPEV